MATYVIMKKYDSPIALVYPTPHEVIVGQKKKVQQRLDALNSKAIRNYYYAELIKTGVQCL